MAQSDFSGDRVDESPEGWAKRLKENKDYRSLAAVFNSGVPTTRYGFTDREKWDQILKKTKLADRILREAGGEAVDAIMEEINAVEPFRGVGRVDLARVLAAIGDPKAVPLIKRMLDRDEFHAEGLTPHFEQFVNRYRELLPETEMNTCALCGKKRPVTEMRIFQPHYFCLDTCWNRRGKIVGSKNAGALNCPYYTEGMCTVDGGNICSLGSGDYATTCYVYRLGKTRRF